MNQRSGTPDTSMSSASVRLDGIPCGTLTSDTRGALQFSYAPSWVAREDAYPVSPVLPVGDKPFGHLESSAFFANLLPDGNRTVSVLAERIGTGNSGILGVLAAVGHDCQGAVTVVPRDTPVVEDRDTVPAYDVLSERELARRIAALVDAPLFVGSPEDARSTLAGMRPKAAVVATGGNVAIPARGTPSTHILKADTGSLPGVVQVEHFSLRLAAALGMDVPASTVNRAEDIPYIVVSRFDRAVQAGEGRPYIGRRHQFDFCQAFGYLPGRKFEKDGGPGWRHCFDLVSLTADPSRDRDELLSRAVFQFLLGNPDAHAKNYALVLGPGGVSLSKLYDVNNAAAFAANFKTRRERVAMAVGGEYDAGAVAVAHWRAFAAETGQDEAVVLQRLVSMAERMPDLASEVRQSLVGSAGDTPMLDIAVDDLAARCARFSNAAPSPGA